MDNGKERKWLQESARVNAAGDSAGWILQQGG